MGTKVSNPPKEVIIVKNVSKKIIYFFTKLMVKVHLREENKNKSNLG